MCAARYHASMLGNAHERVLGGSGRAARLQDVLEAAAFWAAIVLPVAYVPVLGSGVGDGYSAALLAALLAVHLVAVTVGHGHAHRRRP